MTTLRRLPVLLAAVVASAACAGDAPRPAADTPAGAARDVRCDAAEIRQTVERFGERLQHVALLAPDSIRERQLREQYSELVAPRLLDAWITGRREAPGRAVSSPRPDRIEVDSVVAGDDMTCRVFGSVVHVTSADTAGGTREVVRLELVEREGWRITDVAPGRENVDESALDDAAAAVSIIRRYYSAITDRRFREAYAMWGSDGSASGQTLEEFTRGFAETETVSVEPGAPSRVEAAAGSRYVSVPVTVTAMTTSKETQRFQGTYTLRRSVVDGATEAQRRWHIYSADIEPVR